MSYNQTNGNYADTPLSLGTTGWRLPTDQDGEGSAANRRVVIGHSIDQLPTEGEAPLILTLEDESVLAPARNAPLLRNEDRVRDHRHKYFREIQSKLTGIGGAPGDPDEEIFKGKILPKYDIFDPKSVQAGKLELEIGEDGLAQIKKDDNPESWAERNDATWKAPVPGAKGYFNLESNKRVINDYEDKPKPTFKKKGGAADKKHQHQLLPQGFGFLKDEEGAEGLKMRSSDVNGTSLSHIAPETLTTHGGNLNEAYFSSMHDATRLIKTNKMFSDPNESIKDEEDARIDTLIKNSQKMAETKAKSANEQFRQLLQRKKQEAEQFEIRGTALGKRDPETQQEHQVTQSEAQTIELDFRQGISLKSLIGKVGVNNIAVEKKRQQWLSLADQANGSTSVVHVLLPSERLKLQLQEMEDADNLESALPAEESANPEGDEGASKAKEVAKKESLKEPEELAPEEKGPDFSKSTFAALQFFKERGMLNEEKRRVYAGRGNDEKYLKRDERMENQDNSDGIRLDRVNKEGVALTKKQAFREMCWSFHNKQPKKLKRQKMSDRIKQLRAVRSKHNLRQEPKIQPEAWFHEL